MSRLTVDIPDADHRRLKALAAGLGLSLRELILDRLAADLAQEGAAEAKRRRAIEAWEGRRKHLKLERGATSLRALIHEGHKW